MRIRMPLSAFQLVLTIIILLSVNSHISFGQITPIGPGVAGQIHALAFDPDDASGETIYAGGDVCGVYVTYNGGDSWELFNNGLANADLTYSYYIDDLLVLGESSGIPTSFRGVYAATHAGIYFRAVNSSAWELKTSGAEYTYSGGFATPDPLPIPFSCFAYDSADSVLYAGAGHGRWKRGGPWRLYYPEQDSTSTGYSLWKCDFKLAAPVWESIEETSGLGMVKQIAVVDRDSSETDIIYASQDGVHRLKTNPSDDPELWFNSDKSAGELLGKSDRPWGVAAGATHYIYVLTIRQEGEESDDIPGVWRADLRIDPIDWQYVRGDAPSVPPHSENWDDLLVSDDFNAEDFTNIFVIKSDSLGATFEDDEIFIGERSDTQAGGYYRYGSYATAVDTVVFGWVHMLKTDGDFDSFTYQSTDWNAVPPATSSFDVGWVDNTVVNSTTPLIIHPTVTPRMIFAAAYHIPVLSDDDGGSWTQKNTVNGPDYWESTGLDLLGVRALTFDSNNRIVLGCMDFSLFREDPNGAGFKWLDWWDNKKNVLDVEMIGDEIAVLRKAPKKWIRAAQDYEFFGYTTVGTGSGENAIQEMVIAIEDPTQGQSVVGGNGYGWRFISQDIGEPYGIDVEFEVTDIVVANDSTMYASSFSRNTEEGKIFLGTKNLGTWSWLEVYSRDKCNIRELLLIPGTPKLVVAGQYGIGGGVFVLDTNNFSIQEWLPGENAVAGSPLDLSTRFSRVLAYDELSETLYVGSRGGMFESTEYVGSVLRLEGAFSEFLTTLPDTSDWTILANHNGINTFNISQPSNWSLGGDAYKRLTMISDIDIDPRNPRRIYVGFGNRGFEGEGAFFPQNGAWRCDPDGNWTQLTGGTIGDPDLRRNRAVMALGIRPVVEPDLPDELIVGTAGQGALSVAITPSPLPTVSSRAEYTLFAQATNQLLAVKGESAFGDSLGSVYVDASTLGDSIRFELNDSGLDGDLVSGDRIWSAKLANAIQASGEMLLPIVARDVDWNTYSGDLAVEVVAGAVKASYVEAAPVNDELEEIGGLPYSVSLINSGVNLFDSSLTGDLGEEDLLVTIKEPPFRLFESKLLTDGFDRIVDTDRFENANLPVADSYGIVVADYNNDGFEDILSTNYSLPQLYRYDSASSKFDYRSDVDIAGPRSMAYTAAWADYNQDGWIDLVIGGCVEEAAIVLNDPGDPNDPVGGSGSGTGDVSVNATAEIEAHFYKNVQGILVKQIDVFPAWGLASVAFGLSWEDLNDDGFIDLVVGNYFAPGCKVFINGGPANDYSFTEETSTWFPTSSPDEVVGVELIDLDNDGRPDLVLTRMDAVDNLLVYFNDGTKFVLADKAVTGLPIVEYNLADVVTGDFDLNGYQDLVLVPNHHSKTPRMVLNSIGAAPGTYSQTLSLSDVPVGALSSAVANDWDNDGDLDLFFGRQADSVTLISSDYYYTNQDFNGGNPASEVIKIRPVGAGTTGGLTNADAIGSKVEVFDGSITYTQRVSGGNGRGRQNPRTLFFGLPGINGTVDSVRVTWPDGATSLETNVATGPTTHVIRDDRTVAIATNSETAYRSLTPGNLRLIFEWTTNVPLSDIEVEFDPDPGGTNALACECGEGDSIIYLNDDHPDVDIHVVRLGFEEFRHYLILNNWCCNVGCDYEYTMSGEFGDSQVSSPILTFDISVCGKGIGPLPEIEN